MQMVGAVGIEPTASPVCRERYPAERGVTPVEVAPPPSPRKYWTRCGIANWLMEKLTEDAPTLVGIDHAFSFPLRHFRSVNGIAVEKKWSSLTPDENHDWINQGEKSFSAYVPMGSKSTKEAALFVEYSNGVKTQRDAWCYNYSQMKLGNNCCRMVELYNSCVRKYSNLPVAEKKPFHTITS